MGVDFYACDRCHETFPDCGPYAICNECSNRLCDYCMNELKIYNHSMDEECPFCRKDVLTDLDLLNYALNKLNLTKEQLEEEYRKL